MASIFDEKLERLGTNSLKWDRYGDPDIIAMGTADMDFLSPPCVRDALVARAEAGIYAYEAKSDAYYESIIGWFRRRHGWELRREWISYSPGVWAGMRMCIDTFSRPGDKVVVSEPHFHPIVDVIRGSGRVMVTSVMKLAGDRYVMDMEDFEQTVAREKARIFILISPQNPSGRVFTPDELRAMGDVCRRHGVVVVSDEVHANILFDGHTHTPYAAVSEEMAGHSVVLAAPSKAFNLQGLTYGIVIIPNPELRKRYEAALSGYDFDFATNVFSMAAVRAAYDEGEPWLRELNAYLQGNLDYLCDYFRVRIPSIKVIRPEGSYLVWLDCRSLGLGSEELERLFTRQAKVAFTHGHTFGAAGAGFERINIACPRAVLEEALERVEKAVNAIR